MNKIFGLIITIFIFSMVFAGTMSMISTRASTGFEVISPFQGEHIPLINDTCLIVNISVYAPSDIGYTVDLHVSGPYDIQMTSPGIPIGSIGSSGYLNLTNLRLPVTLFEANGTAISHFIPGEYNFTIEAGSNFETISVYFTSPNEVEMIVSVYANGQPLSGATVDVYNETTDTFLVSNTTASNGEATLIVPYVYTMTNTYNVTATKPGYKEVYTTVTVPPDQISAVHVTLNTVPIQFVLTPYFYEDEGIQEPVQPQQINGELVYPAAGFEGTAFSIIINATESGVAVKGATIVGMYTYDGKSITETATYIGSGMYNLTIMLPNATDEIPYVLQVQVTGTYESNTYTFVALISAEANYVALIEQLNSTISLLKSELASNITALNAKIASLNATISLLKSELASNVTALENEIASLNATINSLSTKLSSLNATVVSLESELSSLNATVSSLSSEVTTLKSELSTVNATVSSLSSEVTTLKSEVSSLSSELSSANSSISSLNSKVNSMSTLEYAALGIAIVGLIVAIIAIVLVFRKVA
ncbi:hypothetical protein DFR86_03435 [Acidianus sulfidivorans JP7]|uniref:S-layer protein n=1 Tax=Acidianus sulfidivorans JP7 TaxID=619593 RepID=A0A2U9IL09_9CREN|nr:carboxypeptidase-like regulatory domain-containing protein [Acidianus sulfidivorans]AWR96701.1 hypothetical protein DFR86_03435 [Acidianus sulfidivorans JP7]